MENKKIQGQGTQMKLNAGGIAIKTDIGLNVFDVTTTEWFSMEIRSFSITATGREIQISRLTNVLSFRCICPKCGECFTDELSLKLHCQANHVFKTWDGHEKAETDNSTCRPTIEADSPIKVDGSNTESTEVDSVEFTGLTSDSPIKLERHEHDCCPGNQENSCIKDDENSFSEEDIRTFEVYSVATDADDRAGYKGTFKGSTSTYPTGNIIADRDSTIEDTVAMSTKATKPYRCIDCGRTYSRKSSLIDHRRVHDGHVYKCDKCDKKLSSASALKAHSRTHSRERPYLCTICDRGFLKKVSLEQHIMKHKIESAIAQSQNHQIQLADRQDMPAMPATVKVRGKCKCDICGLKLKGRQKYIEHMSVHTGEKQYICAICGEAYRVKNLLNAHYRKHLGEELYKCDECKKQCSSAAALKAHIMLHTGEKPFICSVCGNGFPRLSNLNTHMKRHKDFTYSCEDCEKSFPTAWALKSHRLTHTGEKPYLCPTCGKRFSSPGGLREHIRVHTGEKPFVCNVCGKGFSQRHCLKDHVTIHEENHGLLCSLCGKSCKHRSALNAHIRTVHQENTDNQAAYMQSQNEADFF